MARSWNLRATNWLLLAAVLQKLKVDDEDLQKMWSNWPRDHTAPQQLHRIHKKYAVDFCEEPHKRTVLGFQGGKGNTKFTSDQLNVLKDVIETKVFQSDSLTKKRKLTNEVLREIVKVELKYNLPLTENQCQRLSNDKLKMKGMRRQKFDTAEPNPSHIVNPNMWDLLLTDYGKQRLIELQVSEDDPGKTSPDPENLKKFLKRPKNCENTNVVGDRKMKTNKLKAQDPLKSISVDEQNHTNEVYESAVLRCITFSKLHSLQSSSTSSSGAHYLQQHLQDASQVGMLPPVFHYTTTQHHPINQDLCCLLQTISPLNYTQQTFNCQDTMFNNTSPQYISTDTSIYYNSDEQTIIPHSNNELLLNINLPPQQVDNSGQNARNELSEEEIIDYMRDLI
jgi:hypothetical protein